MHARAKAAYIAELAEGTRRAARALECPRCGAPVLRGDDHDEMAVVVTVDAEPVDTVGEMLAVLDGRYTCDLVRMRGKNVRRGSYALWHRSDWHIHGDREFGTIHVEHRCDPERQPAHDADVPHLF